MKFLNRSKEGNMFKMENKVDAKGYTWYTLAPNVLEFSKTIQNGSEIDIKIESKNGLEYITFIKVLNSSGNDFKPTEELKCIRCGAKLKDATYKTCYTCSMEIKKEMANSPEEKERQESIKRQAIMHAVSRTLISMQGQVDINNVSSFIDMLYSKYQEKVG